MIVNQQTKNTKLFNILSRLSNFISKKRKRQVFFLFIIMIFSSISETFLLSTTLPFIAVLSNSENIFQNNILSKFYQIFGFGTAANLLFLTSIFFVIAILITTIFRLINLWGNAKLAAYIGNDLSKEAYFKTLSQPYEKHIYWNTSSLIATITSEISITIDALNMLFQLSTSIIVSVGIFLTILFINWKLAISCVFIFGCSYIFIALSTKKRLSRNSNRFASLNQNQFKSLQEGFGAIRDILLNSNQIFYIKDFSTRNKELRLIQAENKFLSFFPRYLLECISLIILIVVSLILSDFSNNNNEFFLPTLGAIALGSQRILPALQQGYSAWALIKGSKKSIVNVIELLELPYTSNFPIRREKQAFKITEYLELSKVTYAYKNSDRNILEDLYLRINKNESIGIIGESGSGKSTLIDIIMCLLEPKLGNIIVDGNYLNPKKNISVTQWRNNISHVPQSIFLADASITENIALGTNEKMINMKKIKSAINFSCLESLITQLPNGLDTVVGEKGIRLSGGQRQRIGIARALYKEAQILILDEATSSLDSKTEKIILNKLIKNKKNMTLITIAHRLTTLKNCDRILTLQNKKIIDVTDKVKNSI